MCYKRERIVLPQAQIGGGGYLGEISFVLPPGKLWRPWRHFQFILLDELPASYAILFQLLLGLGFK
jgi:hypothetical protein